MNTHHQLTRREFLKTSLMGGVIGFGLPSLLDGLVSPLFAAENPVAAKDNPILVVLQLAGGNDGLNTLVPVGNDFYYMARKKIAIAKKATLPLNDELGFHPSLVGLKALYDENALAIIQGVGYPKPNRSHFRSTEIWHTASDSDHTESYGWLGRYFDRYCANLPATTGICIGHEATQAFSSKLPHSITFDDPKAYQPLRGRDMNGDDESDDTTDNDGGSIGSLAGCSVSGKMDPLSFLKQTGAEALSSSSQIQGILRQHPAPSDVPKTALGRNLSLIARLIAGGLSTRVYYLTQGGYDTHTNQVGTQQRLLTELGDGLRYFHDRLKADGLTDRVLLMTYSEFGRRVAENGSGGTDHGTAAPVFLVGGQVKGGVYGKLPSLSPGDLDQGDLRFQTDFRSIYATVLEKHLDVAAKPLLGRNFPLLPVLG